MPSKKSPDKLRGSKMGSGPHKYPKVGGNPSRGKGGPAKGTGLGVGPKYFHKAKAASSKNHRANSVGND